MNKYLKTFIVALIAIIAAPAYAGLLTPRGGQGGVLSPGLIFRDGTLGNAIIPNTSSDTLGDAAHPWTAGYFTSLSGSLTPTGNLNMGGFQITNVATTTGTVFVATSTTATSTFASGIQVTSPAGDYRVHPQLEFTSGLGFYTPSVGRINVALTGTPVFSIDTTSMRANQTNGAGISANNPSATVPGFNFNGDLTTGLGRASAGVMNLISNGANMLQIAPTGVSVGTTTTPADLTVYNVNPTLRLNAASSGSASFDYYQGNTVRGQIFGGSSFNIDSTTGGQALYLQRLTGSDVRTNTSGGKLVIASSSPSSVYAGLLTVNASSVEGPYSSSLDAISVIASTTANGYTGSYINARDVTGALKFKVDNGGSGSFGGGIQPFGQTGTAPANGLFYGQAFGVSQNIFTAKTIASQTGDIFRALNPSNLSLVTIGGNGNMSVGTSTTPAKFAIQGDFGGLADLFNVATTTSAAYATSSMFRIERDGGVHTSQPMAPTLSSCGTSPTLSTNATDQKGTVTVGATGTGCTVTFVTPETNADTCVVTPRTGSVTNTFSYTVSTTAITVTETGLGGNLFDYMCLGN